MSTKTNTNKIKTCKYQFQDKNACLRYKEEKLTALWCRRMQEVQKSTQLCMSRSPTSHHKCKVGLGIAHRESVSKRTAPEMGGMGCSFCPLRQEHKKPNRYHSAQYMHKDARDWSFFFFFLKKGCTSAPCSMWRLKLTLQALQLQPLATHRNVASGYRQEVAQSPSLPQPHHWYCTPVVKAMTTKCLVFWPHSPEPCSEKVWHMQSSQTCLQLWMQDPLCHKTEKGTTTT